MYSLEYQIEKAFAIAAQNGEAHVGVFCNWKDAKRIIESLKPAGEIKWQTKVFISTSGGAVRFYEPYGFDNLRDKICATCFSHVFTNGDFGYLEQAMIRSRLRSTRDFVEPMGYYDEIGVHRYEGY